jgi:hypothetical protein
MSPCISDRCDIKGVTIYRDGKKSRLFPSGSGDTIATMNGITIYIDWPYFLSIVGTLIGVAYYANGRLTKIETSVEWLKAILLEIKEELETRDDRGLAGNTYALRRPKHEQGRV